MMVAAAALPAPPAIMRLSTFSVDCDLFDRAGTRQRVSGQIEQENRYVASGRFSSPTGPLPFDQVMRMEATSEHDFYGGVVRGDSEYLFQFELSFQPKPANGKVVVSMHRHTGRFTVGPSQYVATGICDVSFKAHIQ